MTAFFALFMMLFFALLSRVALLMGNDYNKIACMCMALAFWAACVGVVALA